MNFERILFRDYHQFDVADTDIQYNFCSRFFRALSESNQAKRSSLIFVFKYIRPHTEVEHWAFQPSGCSLLRVFLRLG